MDKRADVVIVGGGLAGLAAAAVAARAGAAVRVLERSGEPGGRARTRDLDGFLLNLGPHALFRQGAGLALLRELSVPVEGRVPRYDGLALRDGAAHVLPSGPRSLFTTRLLSPLGKLEFARLLSRLQRGTAVARPGQALESWIRAQGLRADAEGLLRTLLRVATYADDPGRQDASAALAQLRLAANGGVLYLDGGWQGLVSGLKRAAGAAGAELATGTRAEALEADSQGVRGVRDATGAFHAARRVILAVPPSEAARLAGALAPPLRAAAEAAVPVFAACLDLGLRPLPRPASTFALGIDRPWYLSVHSATARLAPDGQALVHALRYLGPDRPASAEVEREMESLMDRVQPGWREQVQVRRFVPELAVANDLQRPGGRPSIVVPGVAGLHLAGDWVGGEGLLADASLASARAAARVALGAPWTRAA
jgi:phytoene dehydrogenase-like protein